MALSPKALNDGERVVVTTRTHVKALLAPALWLVLLLAVAGFSDTSFADGTTALVVWVLAGVLALWLVAWPVLEWATASYTITDRRLITRNGVLTRRGHDIPLTRVSDVAYEMGLIDRMLGCGTLIISDASTLGRVPLHDIPDVESVQRTLNQLLHELHGSATGNDDT
ncbi:MAG TPA: PH domain-containing protein [Nocardioides sp.]|uniref:PH domain-containing protein n=1 Tax=Nocardioides sp. TaxID=35761 RepID=UPI002BE634C4|nr:PH domain-containing protein [Nocardioides sp.]HQR27212.1 PH domain-containing protein [Nocardioides sp.]